MTKTPPHTIGYFAVVVPDRDAYQGAFLIDDPSLHHRAVMMQMTAMMTMPDGAIGALQASVVHGCVTGDQTVMAAAALGLHGITKRKFFIITSTDMGEGLSTNMRALDVTTIEAARAEIEKDPAVVAINERRRTGKVKPRHAV
jgi:hypothetical protein